MNEWGPLAALAGTWEGNDGLDVSYHNVRGAVGETGYFEKVELKPFGPVDNGKQSLYGLDYRMAAWRHGEEDQNPFHTEVGYWLWDAADGQVMRCFMVPRGAVLIAGAACAADARTFTMRADPGVATYGILENAYLAVRASTRHYECTVTVVDDNSWRYESDTVVRLETMGGEMHHTDRNTLRTVADG
ncbi:MAG TPA: heme-binding beta-barrel domain-containing protein [Acidimicrobiales bacterium]|nr:heme-binding beta-barrel domain-containing protein [Acidimicrobiales bacterium]